MYKLRFDKSVELAERLVFIPFDSANTDYLRFKRDIAEGAELRDANGEVMSAEAVAEFLESLP